MSAIDSLLDPMPLPRIMKVQQDFDKTHIKSISASVAKGFKDEEVYARFSKGMRVAITVGSRGIADLPVIVGSVVAELKNIGTFPFIVPAMGSHGAGSAIGQEKILADMGITEDTIGAPIVSSLDTVQVTTTESGLPVFMDEAAYHADATVVLNRIHPHVSFRGDYESGLMKMIAIGLGKLKGANICHDLGFGEMAKNVPEIGEACIRESNISLGIAILENAYHEVNDIVFVTSEKIKEMEPSLLDRARQLEPCLYIRNIDVLIMSEIGKDISGSGFDTNIIGRYGTPYISGGPSITKLGILDVTDVSHGNCTGIGMAEFTTRRLFEKLSFDDTYPNSLTSTVQNGIKIPMVLKNDKQVFQAAIKTSNVREKEHIRLVLIKNTLKVGQFYISEALVDEAAQHPKMKVMGTAQPIEFDDFGNLVISWD